MDHTALGYKGPARSDPLPRFEAGERRDPSRSDGRGEGIMKTALSQQRAQDLRRQSTEAEKKLWQLLRNRQFDGLKFRRQAPIGPYIADFLAVDALLSSRSTATSIRATRATIKSERLGSSSMATACSDSGTMMPLRIPRASSKSFNASCSELERPSPLYGGCGVKRSPPCLRTVSARVEDAGVLSCCSWPGHGITLYAVRQWDAGYPNPSCTREGKAQEGWDPSPGTAGKARG